MTELRPIEERADSEFNGGWRYGVVVGSGVTLLLILLSLLAIVIGLFNA